ncbi:MAG: hypothetical protein GXX99_07300 [Clostridiales bacterium]|nr:hypothetical protein [Clostridiales bacterium]
MKKKSLSVLCLVLGLLLAVAGCAKEVRLTPYERFEAANSKLEEVPAYSMDLSMVMSLVMEEATIEVTTTGTSKQRTSDGEILMEQVLVMNMMGQEVTTRQWYADGMFYQEAMGQKQAIATPIEELRSQLLSGGMDFTKESIKSESAEGNTLTFVLDGQKLIDLVMAQMSGITGMLGEQSSIHIGDIHMVVVVDEDNNMVSTNMDFPMDISIDLSEQGIEEPMEMSITASVVCDNIQVGEVEINLPADLDSYTLVDA